MNTLPPFALSRNRPRVSGIYAITNITNGKQYIGRSTEIEQRWYRHVLHLRNGDHHSTALQNAWNKYGEASFTFSILEYVEDKTLLSKREQHFFNTLRPEYNIQPYAGSWMGMSSSEETKEKLRIAHTGLKMPEGHGEKMAGINKGRVRSPEFREKLRVARTGKTLSDESKAKISDAKKGKTHSDESKAKISRAQTGKKHTPETIEKIVSYHIGAKRSPESRARMSASAKNRRKREREAKIE